MEEKDTKPDNTSVAAYICVTCGAIPLEHELRNGKCECGSNKLGNFDLSTLTDY